MVNRMRSYRKGDWHVCAHIVLMCHIFTARSIHIFIFRKMNMWRNQCFHLWLKKLKGNREQTIFKSGVWRMNWGAAAWGMKLLRQLVLRQRMLLYLFSPNAAGWTDFGWEGFCRVVSFTLCADILLHWHHSDAQKMGTSDILGGFELSCPALCTNHARLWSFQSGCFLLLFCTSWQEFGSRTYLS